MKKLITVMLALMAINVFSFSQSELKMIEDVAFKQGVPQKSLIKFAKQEQELNSKYEITEVNLEKLSRKFDKDILPFAGKLTIIGMLVVFVSLIVIGVIIGQIKHISRNNKPKKRKNRKVVQTSIGSIETTESDISTNSVIAVITALHMHIQEVDAKNKLNMDWKRAPVSMWKSVSKAKFPNQDYRVLSRR